MGDPGQGATPTPGPRGFLLLAKLVALRTSRAESLAPGPACRCGPGRGNPTSLEPPDLRGTRLFEYTARLREIGSSEEGLRHTETPQPRPFASGGTARHALLAHPDLALGAPPPRGIGTAREVGGARTGWGKDVGGERGPAGLRGGRVASPDFPPGAPGAARGRRSVTQAWPMQTRGEERLN